MMWTNQRFSRPVGGYPQVRAKRSDNRKDPGGSARDQLYNEARQRNIKDRSKMSKKQLQRALGR